MSYHRMSDTTPPPSQPTAPTSSSPTSHPNPTSQPQPHPSHPAPHSGKDRPILFSDGWHRIYNDGIAKLQVILSSQFQAGTAAFSNNEYVELYTLIYQMCIQKPPHSYTPQLYEQYDKCIADYLTTTTLPALTSDKMQGQLLLKELVRRWDDHRLMRKWMFDFFRYLDRFYVKRAGKKPLADVALARFRMIVFEQVKGRVTKAVLEQVERDRNGEVIDRQLLHDVVVLYIEMGQSSSSGSSSSSGASSSSVVPVSSARPSSSTTSASAAPVPTSASSAALRVYQHELERPLLKATTEYYARECSSWLSTDSCPEYLRKVEERIREERRRCVDYLHPTTEAALLAACYDTLLIAHQTAILEKENTGVKAMLEAHSEAGLTRVFSLYSNVPSSLPPIARIVQQHIVDVGLALIDKINSDTGQTAQQTYIEELMTLHEKYYELVRLFHSHSAMQKALREAMELVVNRQLEGSSTAELLAVYADDVLKKGGVKLTEKQVGEVLENLVRLFAYLVDKDLFSEFYRKQLATRLLMQRSASSDAEKAMIGKLKLRCGAQFTSKLEGMINDMRAATDHVGEFKAFLRQRQLTLSGIDFTVQTLSTGFWPSYPLDELKLPSELQTCIESFRVYYDSKTNNRRLKWIHDLGTVTLAAGFPKKRVDLIVTTVQATILLLFNGHDQLTVQQLTTLTQLEADSIKQQLKALVNGKYKLLIKQPTDGYAPTHVIRPNLHFTNPMRSIRIQSALRKVGARDRDTVSRAVAEDRKHAMEACIVRVMKARKTVSHQQLMAEVSAQLMAYFQPDPKEIKLRIEDLIQREYMERDKDNKNTYHYLA